MSFYSKINNKTTNLINFLFFILFIIFFYSSLELMCYLNNVIFKETKI